MHGFGFGADFLLRRTGLAASSASPPHVQIREWELPDTFIYRFQRPPEPFMPSLHAYPVGRFSNANAFVTAGVGPCR
jgi:hypothetical protein